MNAAAVVVIVNWQRPEDTLACLQSVLQTTDVALQVLVVDNGSQDDSCARIAQTFPQVALLPLPENRGYAGGYNAGIQWALEHGAEAVFLLNNDTVIDSVTIPALVNSPWDVAIPKILYFDHPDRIWAAGSRWRRFPPAILMNGYKQADGPRFSQEQSLEYATGCALLCRRAVLERVPGFDPAFENYMEDYDFAYRVRQAGFQIGYVPQARVLHKVSQTLGEGSPRRWQFLGQNTVLFYRKPGRFSLLTLWAYLAWFSLRESLQGRAALLPHFWRGVQQGFHRLNNMKYD